VGAGSASFGAPVVGPAGLVTLLEAELGLGDPPSSVLDRVVAWQAKREAADGSERFWTRSLAADAWATARLLLGWRDDLVAAGWRPDVGCSEHRLDDLPAPSRRLIRQLADAGAEVPERPPAMIVKPYVDREERDPRRSAGRRAERQMAHYLDRQFREHTKLHVLHDVRIEHGGEVAQMDHLVVHGFGVAIVESKSVSTSVRINAAGEWERRWDRQWRGMPDPILQGERQGLVLKRLLTRGRMSCSTRSSGCSRGRSMPWRWTCSPRSRTTARSSARSVGKRRGSMKADAIPEAIENLVASYRRTRDS
jgi:hypothetical protein